MGDEISINATPALPAWERHTTVATPDASDVTTKALSPDQVALQGQQDSLLQQQTDIADRKALADAADNHVKAETAQQMSDASAQLAKDREKAIADTDEQISQWRTRLRDANDKFTTAPLPSLFHSGDDGNNVLKAIGLLVANVGDARRTSSMLRAGQAPGVGSGVDDIIANDFAVQRARIEKLKDNAVMAASGLKDAEEGRKLLLANIDVKQSAVYDRIAKLMSARLGAIADKGAPGQEGTDAAKLARDSAVSEWTDKALAKKADAVNGLATSVTKKFGGTQENITRAPTDDTGKGGQAQVRQNKVYNDVTTALDAAKEIDPAAITPDVLSKIQANQTEAEGAEHTGKVPVIGAAVVNAGRDAGLIARGSMQGIPDQAAKSYSLLQRLVATTADARQATGEGPAQDYYSKVMPQPGDSPAVVRGKVEQLRKDAATFAAIQDPNDVGAQRVAARNANAPVKAIGNAVPTPAVPTPANANAPIPGQVGQQLPGGAPDATPKQLTPRDRAIRLLKENPAVPGAATLARQYNIKPSDLQGAP